MARRVRRPKDKSKVLAQLTDMEQGGPFATLKDALVFSAAIGYWKGRREAFDTSDEPIAWDVFKNDDRAFINMLVLASTQQLELLSDAHADDRLQVFEEFANGGLGVIEHEVIKGTVPVVQSVVDFMSEAGSTDDETLPELKQIAELLGGGNT